MSGDRLPMILKDALAGIRHGAGTKTVSIKREKELDADKVNKWLTLGANFGVLAGLILVTFELHQSTVTTRAEMISDFQDRWVAMDMSWQDAEFAAAWAKAIENPEELTTAEMIQLSGQLWAFIDHLNSIRRMWELGVFDEPLPSLEVVIANNVKIFFGNAFAQSWWAEYERQSTGVLTELMAPEIEKVSVTRDLEYFERIRSHIRD